MNLIRICIGIFVLLGYLQKVHGYAIFQVKDKHDFVKEMIETNLLNKVSDVGTKARDIRCYLSYMIEREDPSCSYNNFCNQKCLHWSYYRTDIERTQFSGCLLKSAVPILDKVMISIHEGKDEGLTRKATHFSFGFNSLMGVYSKTFETLEKDYGIRLSCPEETFTAFRSYPTNDSCIHFGSEGKQPKQEELIFQVFKEINSVVLYLSHYLDPFVTYKKNFEEVLGVEQRTCKNENDLPMYKAVVI